MIADLEEDLLEYDQECKKENTKSLRSIAQSLETIARLLDVITLEK